MSLRLAALRALGVVAVVVAVDQLTKAAVRSALEVGETRDLLLFVDLTHVRNRGVAFGAFSGGGTIVAVLVAAALVALVAYFATHASKPWMWLPTGLLLGGAVGNIVDRVRDGEVTDFIKLPYWPAFNVADIAITLGVILLVLLIERDDAPADRGG
jgi:signal peptidase II